MWSSVPVAALSFVTTLHLAAILLLSHRRAVPGRRLLLLPAICLAVLVWLLPVPAWLLAGVVAQVTWVVACERLLPAGGTASAPPPPAESPVGRPAAGSAPKRPTAAAGFVAVRVLAVIDETPEIRTFRMKRPEDFAFRSGQFLMVRVAAGGKDEVRCYSISSAPEDTGYLEISVRRQGRASGALHESIRAGGLLPIRGPGGSFVYPEEPNVPIVLHAGGVGVTPMISMLRHAAKAEPGRPVTFLYTVRDEPDIAFRDELAVFARRAPGVRVFITLSRGEAKPGFLTGRMDVQKIVRHVPDPAKAIHMICGPAPMIESLRAGLASLGVPDGRIRFEAFEAAVATASDSVGDAASYAVRFSRSGGATTVPAGTTLLDAAEAAGAPVDSMCRAGTCGTCKTRLVSGRVQGDGKALRSDEREAGWILPCVSFARSDCELDV